MNSKAAIVAGLCLTLGLLVGMVIGGSGGAERTVLAPRAVPVLDGENAASASKAQPTEPVRESAPVAASSLAVIIEQAKILPLPEGSGVITGIVRTRGGEPLEGAVVTATPNYPEDRNRTGMDTEQRVLEQIRYEKWREHARKSAASKGDGSFRIEGLASDTDYAVWAELDGWAFDRTPHRNYFTAGMEVTFTGKESIRVPVEIRLPDGSAPRHGSAEFHRKGEPNSKISTNTRNGRSAVGLEPGEWVGSASAGENWEYRSEKIEFTVEPGKAHAGVVLQLIGRPGVKGVITVPQGYVFWGLQVTLLPGTSPEPGPVLTSEDVDAAVGNEFAHAENDWKFQLLDVPAGTYRVILHADQRVLDWRSVTIDRDAVVCDLVVPAPQAKDYIPVRVFDSEGVETDRVTIQLRVASESRSFSSGASLYRPDSTGKLFWVRRVAPEEVFPEQTTEWRYDVTVISAAFGQLTRPYARTDTHELQFRFEQPAFVELTVPGFDDHELSEALRWSVVKRGDEGHRADERGRDKQDTRAAGEPFRFGPFTPGEYELVLMYAMRVRQRELVRRPLSLSGGDNYVQSDIPLLGTLTVRCQTESEANGLTLYSGSTRYAIWDDEVKREGATARYYALPPGEYRLQTSAGVMRVAVSGDTAIDFAPRTYDCLEIRSVRPGGQVEALGLKSGDKLVEVDGNPCTDIKTFRAHVDLSLSRDSTTWTVLRDGIRMDVTFSGQALTEIMKNKRENKEDLDLDRGYRD